MSSRYAGKLIYLCAQSTSDGLCLRFLCWYPGITASYQQEMETGVLLAGACNCHKTSVPLNFTLSPRKYPPQPRKPEHWKTFLMCFTIIVSLAEIQRNSDFQGHNRGSKAETQSKPLRQELAPSPSDPTKPNRISLSRVCVRVLPLCVNKR